MDPSLQAQGDRPLHLVIENAIAPHPSSKFSDRLFHLVIESAIAPHLQIQRSPIEVQISLQLLSQSYEFA